MLSIFVGISGITGINGTTRTTGLIQVVVVGCVVNGGVEGVGEEQGEIEVEQNKTLTGVGA